MDEITIGSMASTMAEQRVAQLEENLIGKDHPEMVTLTCSPCVVCGESSTVDMTEQEYSQWAISDDSVQKVFPNRSPEWRELLISGTHPDCFDGLFS